MDITQLFGQIKKKRSFLCVGLDTDIQKIPAHLTKSDDPIFSFNKEIIDHTAAFTIAYKPNLAFYEALGIKGLTALQKTIEYIPADIPIIGDAKRGDIGNTAKAYAKALFSTFGFDAATVNPYLGFDSIEPFISYQDKGVFILCRTSNRGASDFQDLRCTTGPLLYEAVAQKAREWNVHGNIGLVVGATYPQELKSIRSICAEMPLLIPGIGAQGGDLSLAVSYGVDAKGEKAIINVSRQVLYASKEKDFAQAAKNTAEKIRSQINSYLFSIKKTK